MSRPTVALAPLRRLRSFGFAPHFAVDLRGPVLLWASSRWTLRGWEFVEWGREERPKEESLPQFVERVAHERGAAGALVSVSLRHPDLQIRRLELPGLSERDTRDVAFRRLDDLRDEIDGQVNAAFVIGPKAEKRSVWMMACPSEFTEFSEQQWTSLGLSVGRIDSLHLALGALTRLMEAPGERQLRAFLDFGPVHATCVLADEFGWVFSRDLSLKTTADSRSASDANERIATELRRTFHYADGELGLGRVRELVLSGDRDDLEALTSDLGSRISMPAKLLGEALEGTAAEGADPQAAVVIGLTLTTDMGGGSLLPRTAQRLRRASLATRRMLAVTAAMLLVVLAGVARIGAGFYLLSEERHELAMRWDAQQPARERTEREADSREIGRTLERANDTVFAERPDWLAAIEAVGLVLPEEAVVERWQTVERDGRYVGDLEVELRDNDLARATESISMFRSALASAPHWRILSVERRRSGSRRMSGDGADAVVRTRVRLEIELATVEREEPAEDEFHG